MTNIICVIQARMGSSRVPGMIDRVRRVEGVTDVVLATTQDPRNQPMIELAAQEGLKYHCQPGEDDIAGRIAGAIKNCPGDIVLKVGGDCPLIDPEVLQKIVNTAVAAGDADFVSNRLDWSYPLGLSADVLSRKAIEWCDENFTDAEDRELFAVRIRDNPDRFKVIGVVNDVDLSRHGWTVDEPKDVGFMRDIFDHLYRKGEVFGMAETLAYLTASGKLDHG